MGQQQQQTTILPSQLGAARSPIGQLTVARPPIGQLTVTRPPIGQLTLTRPPIGQLVVTRPPIGQLTARPDTRPALVSTGASVAPSVPGTSLGVAVPAPAPNTGAYPTVDVLRWRILKYSIFLLIVLFVCMQYIGRYLPAYLFLQL